MKPRDFEFCYFSDIVICRENEAQQKKMFEIGLAVAETERIEFLTSTRWRSSCDNLIFYFTSYV